MVALRYGGRYLLANILAVSWWLLAPAPCHYPGQEFLALRSLSIASYAGTWWGETRILSRRTHHIP